MPTVFTHPTISVVIPAYNEELYLARCLTAVKNQCFDLPFEILVVNNCSTDNTSQIAQDYGVRVITEKKKGQQYARQTGVLAAKAPLVAMLDADNSPKKDWLEHIYAALGENRLPDVVAVTNPYEYPKGTPNWAPGNSAFMHFFLKLSMSIFHRIPHLWGGNCAFLKNEFVACGGYGTMNPSPWAVERGLAKKLGMQGRVIWDPEMVVVTFGRRVQEGLWHCLVEFILISYFGTHIWYKLTKRSGKFRMKDIR
jgi:peptidoglycan-N-acetylglucosamine deacetylase